MTALLREVDRAALFAEGLARERDRLALQMILEGRFFSNGWRIAECLYLDGNTVRYACFPLAPA